MNPLFNAPPSFPRTTPVKAAPLAKPEIIEERMEVVKKLNQDLQGHQEKIKNLSLLKNPPKELEEFLNDFNPPKEALVLTNLAFSATGTGHEGWKTKKAAKLYKQLLKGPKLFSKEPLPAKIGTCLDQVIGADLDPAKIAENVKNLKAGDSYLMEGGWEATPRGHAMLYRFEKTGPDAYNIYVYNAQEGTENYAGGETSLLKKLAYPCIKFESVTHEELFFAPVGGEVSKVVFRSLLDLRDPAVQKEDTDIKDVLKCFFHLGHRLVPSDKLSALFITMQRSGNCPIKTLNCFLLETLQDRSAYKKTSLDFRLLTLMGSYHSFINGKEGLEKEEYYGMKFMLQEAGRNYLRLLETSFKKPAYQVQEKEYLKAAATVLDMLNTLEELAPVEDVEEFHLDPWVNPQNEKAEAEERVEGLKELAETPIGEQAKPLIIKNFYFDLKEPFTFASLSKTLETLDVGLFALKMNENLEEGLFCMEKALRDIGQALSHRSPTEITPEEANLALDKVLKVLLSYRALKTSTVVTLARQNTLIELLLLGRDLAIRADSSFALLEQFGLHTSYFENLLNTDRLWTPFNKEVLEQRERLLEKINTFKGKPALFNFENPDANKEHFKDQKIPEAKLYYGYLALKEHPSYDDILEGFYNFESLKKADKSEDYPFIAYSRIHTWTPEVGLTHIKKLQTLSLLTIEGFGIGGTKSPNNDHLEIQSEVRGGKLVFHTGNFNWSTEHTSALFKCPSKRDYSPEGQLADYLDHPQSSREEDHLVNENRLLALTDLKTPDPRLPFYIALSEPQCQTSALIQALKEHLEVLSDKNTRLLMNVLFLKVVETKEGLVTPFLDAFAPPAGSLAPLESLLLKGKAFFIDPLPEAEQKIEEMLFLINLYGKALATLSEEKAFPPESLAFIRDLLKMMDKWALIETLDWRIKPKMALAKAALLLHLPSSASTLDEQVELFQQMLILKNAEASLFEEPAFVRECRRVYYERPVENRLQGEALNRFASDCLQKVLGGHYSLQCEWKGKTIEGKDESGEIWTIDLPTLTLSNTQGTLGTKPFALPDPIRHRLFKMRPHEVRSLGHEFYFTDPLWGPIKTDRAGTHLQRLVGTKWYTYVPCDRVNRRLLHVNGALFYDHAYWWETGNPQNVIVSDIKTGAEVGRLKDGFLSRGTGPKLFFSSIENPPLLTRFEKPLYISAWSEDLDKEGSETLIELPRFQNREKTLLAFSKDAAKGKWIYNPNPEYSLYEGPSWPLPLHIDRFLPLVDSKDQKRKVVIPLTKITSKGYSKTLSLEWPAQDNQDGQKNSCTFIEYPLDAEGFPVAEDLEAKIYLAHLWLAQKEYKTAHDWIKKIELTEAAGEKEVARATELLEESLGLLQDTSPNAAALRLHLWLRLKKIHPLLQLPSVADLYKIYLLGLNNVELSLRLTAEDELELLDLMGEFEERKNALIKDTPLVSQRFIIPASPKENKIVPNLQYLSQIENSAHLLQDKILRERYRKFTRSSLESVSSQELLYELALEVKSYLGSEYAKNRSTILQLAARFPSKVPPLPSENDSREKKDTWLQAIIDLLNASLGAGNSDILDVRLKIPFPAKTAGTHHSDPLQPPLLPPRPLIAESEIVLSTESHDALFLKWKESCFSVPPPKNPLKKALKPLVLNQGEKIFESAITARREHYANDCLEAQKIALKKAYFKDDAPYEQVVIEMKNELKASKKREEKLKSFIETASRRPPAAYTPHIKFEIELKGRKKETSPLESILRAAIQENGTSALLEINPSLSEREALLLRDACFEYMIEATHRQHVQRVLDPLNKWIKSGKVDTSEFDLAQEALRESRNYAPKTRPFALLFEYLSGLRVRAKQASIINLVTQSVLEGASPEEQNKVFQLIMAGGKTSVILSMLVELASEKGNLACVLCHPSQLTSAKGSLSAFQKKRFGKDSYEIDLSLKELSDGAQLKAVLKKIKDSEKKRLPLIMKTSFPQMVQLKRILEIKRFLSIEEGAAKTSAFEHIQALGELLDIFRKKGVSFYDEGDINLSIMTDVIIPTGEEKSVPANEIDLVKSLYQWLISPEIAPLLKLEKNLQNELPPEELQSKVLPILADKLADHPSLLVKDRESFKAYVLDKIPAKLQSLADEPAADLSALSELERNQVAFLRKLNSLDEETADLIRLSKLMLTKTLPISLSKIRNRHYGRDPSHPDGRIIPYVGVGQPATTQFGNVYLKLAYHFQAALNEPIKGDELAFLASKMNEAAMFYAKKERIALEATTEAKQFLAMTGVPLSEFNKPGKKEEALAYVNDPEHLERRLEVEGEVAPFHAYFHPGRLESNAINNVSQFGKSVVCSGTPWNLDTYHRRFETPALEKGTEGSILNRLEEQSNDPKCIHEIPTQTLESFSALLKNHPQKNKVRALVDGGGLLRDYTNPEIAAALHKDLLKDNLGGVKALIYLHTFSPEEIKAGSPKESFVLLKIEPDAKPILLKNTTREEIEKHGIKYEELFAFMDELRATGTDIELADDAIFLNTVDHQMPMRTALQAFLRARKLFRGQTVEYITTRTGREQMVNHGASFEDLRTTWEKNEAILLKLQTDRSQVKQIHDVIRSKIMQELELVKTQAQLTDWGNKYTSWLIISSEERLTRQFGKIGGQVKKIEALKTLGQKMVNDFKKLKSPFADEAAKEMEELLASLATIIPQDEMMTIPLEMDQEAQIEVEQEHELNLALQQAQDLELAQELEQELDLYAIKVPEEPTEETPWNLSPSKKLFAQMEPSLTQAKEALADFAPCFAPNVFLSSNFSKTLVQEISLLHPRSKQVGFVLMLEAGPGKFNYVFISEKEAGYFKTWLQKNPQEKAHLVNLEGFEEAKGMAPKEEAVEQALAKGVWSANFYNGNLDYLEAHPDLTKTLLQGVLTPATHYLALKGARSPLKRQKMTASTLFDFNNFFKSQEAPLHGGIEFSARRLERQKINLRVRGLDEEGLGKLEPQYIPHISTAQVPWIKTKDQLERLPKSLINHITLPQLQMLSEEKRGWITNETLISQMDDTMFASLTDQQLGVLSLKENIQRVPLSKISHIKLSSRPLIEGIDNLLALPNDKGLSETQKSTLSAHFKKDIKEERLKPWHAAYLPDEKIRLLKDRKVIAGLPPDKATHLLDTQWRLITGEEKTFIQSLPYPLCLKVAPRLASCLAKEQVEKLQSQDKSFIDHLESAQQKFLTITPIEKSPAPISEPELHHLTKRQDLLQVPLKRRHELTDLQLKKIYVPNAQTRRVHVVQGIFLSLVFPFRVIGEFLFNFTKLLGTLVASPFSPKIRKTLKKTARETFVNAPARAAICSVMASDYVRYKRLYWRFGGKG